ncbi:MAG: hypothetical protein SW833_10125 [Cyanobacteriota bacterium]|nr:hypothetical protein [Cyanobacteriota bacterium]
MNDDRSRLRHSATEAFEDSLEQLKHLFKASESAGEEVLEEHEEQPKRDRASPKPLPYDSSDERIEE